MERLLGPLAAILFFCVIGAAVNYYMELGWFGRFGRFVLVLTMLAVLIFFTLLQHMGRKR